MFFSVPFVLYLRPLWPMQPNWDWFVVAESQLPTWIPTDLLLFGLLLVGGNAYAVFQRRDIGSGVLAARPGPDRAGPGLRGPFGLAWNLQRASVVGWAAGLFLMGLAYGSIGDDASGRL